MMFSVHQCDDTIPGTFAEELAKAAIRYPVRAGVVPETLHMIYAFFARQRLKNWNLDGRRAVRAVPSNPVWEYERYRKTSLWQRIRKRVLMRDGWCCARCGGEATGVHHRSHGPAVMEGRDDSQLARLCAGCHKVVEFRPDGSRNTGAERKTLLFEKGMRRVSPGPKINLRRTRREQPSDWERMNFDEKRAGRNTWVG